MARATKLANQLVKNSNKEFEMIDIEGHYIEKFIHKGEPVVTFRWVDKVYEKPSGTARQAFNQHHDKLIENKDFFNLSCGEWDEVTGDNLLPGGQDINENNPMIVLTEIGCTLLAKDFTDDRDWKVYRALLENYFEIQLPPHVAKLKNKWAMIQLELEHYRLTMEMQQLAKEEAERIHKGNRSLHDLELCSGIQTMAKVELEKLRQEDLFNAPEANA